jgi:hypothetical protein
LSRVERNLVLGYAAVVALFTFATLAREPYDDSYFFKRFALNALDHGALAWNVADGPVYGITSQLFQAIAIATAAVTREYWMFSVRVLLALSLVGAFWILLAIAHRASRSSAAAVAFCSPVALYSVLSGMETAICFALLAGLLWLLFDQRGQRVSWVAAPILSFLAWLARPDTVLLTLPPLLVSRWVQAHRAPLRELLCLGALVTLTLGCFKLYYGTALPLPFYAKQLLVSPYDAHFIQVSNEVQKLRFGISLVVALPLAFVGALRLDRENLTLLGSALLFDLYHLMTTIEVMGMQGRFYAPALPLLVIAAARAGAVSPRPSGVLALLLGYFACFGLLVVGGRLPLESGWRLDQVPLPHYFATATGALVLFLSPLVERLRAAGSASVLAATAVAIPFAHGFEARAPASDLEYIDRHVAHTTVYRGIGVLRACFGDAIEVYHSEVGVPGLVFQHGRVVDLAGLMSPDAIFRRRSFDTMCAVDQPEAIFLPHKNYRELNAEILRGRCVQSYRRVVEESSSPLYVREDLHARYLECSQTLSQKTSPQTVSAAPVSASMLAGSR